MVIEVKTLAQLVRQGIMPAVLKYRKELVSLVVALDKLNSANVEYQILEEINKDYAPLLEQVKKLQAEVERVEANSNFEDAAHEAASLIGQMEKVRSHADNLEAILPHEFYPLPKYNEILLSED